MAARREGSATSRVSVTLEKTDHEFLQRLARQRDRSVSWVAARAIHLFLAEARKAPDTVLGLDSPTKDYS